MPDMTPHAWWFIYDGKKLCVQDLDVEVLEALCLPYDGVTWIDLIGNPFHEKPVALTKALAVKCAEIVGVTLPATFSGKGLLDLFEFGDDAIPTVYVDGVVDPKAQELAPPTS